MTPAEFKTRFTAFAAETDERIQLFIDDAAPFFDVARWDDWYSAGIGNYVAHQLVVANALAASGTSTASPVAISKTVGSVSVTYSSAQADGSVTNPFLATGYGREYYRLAQMVGAGGATACLL